MNDENEIDEIEPPTKKRKLSIAIGETSSTDIELKYLKLEKEEWKQLAQKLEAEKRQHIDKCNAEKILELEDTVAKLQTINDELQAKNQQEKNLHKNEMDFVKNEYETKIKTMENEKRESRAKIKELNNKIASIKPIKPEPKDYDENQQEIFQAQNYELKAEINELKKQITTLENEKKELEAKIKELADEILPIKIIKSEVKESIEADRETGQTKNRTLKAEKQKKKDKIHVLEATITKNKKEYASTIDGLETENQELKNSIQVLENNEREEIVSLDEVSIGSKLNLSLLSCKTNIIINVSKLERTSSESWKLYATLNRLEKPRLLTEKDMMDTCFKINIADQFIAITSGSNLHHIMCKINTCQLTKLHLAWQKINYIDYQKLVSSKKVEICTLKLCTVLKKQNKKKCEMDELLMHLPNITEFKYISDNLNQSFSMMAKNLGKLDKFRNLQKFEISHFYDSINLQELHCFIKKNNKDISYVFKFPLVQQKSLQSKIKSSEKKLLKALPFSYNIKVVL